MNRRWWDRAACKPPLGVDAKWWTGQFFPDRGEATAEYIADMNARFCGPCPVRDDCLEACRAEETLGDIVGFRAGMSAAQRRRFLSRSRRQVS